MKQKQAMIKLAQVRLAINHVLRQRMVKSAVFQAVEKTSEPKPKYATSYNDPDYVKPEFQYLQRIGDMMAETPGRKNNIMVHYTNPNTYYSALPFGSQIPNSHNIFRLDPFNKYNYPNSSFEKPWKTLAHRASLPAWHPDYASKEEVNQVTSAFYDAYNGQRGNNVEYGPYIEYEPNENSYMPWAVRLQNAPMYPVEGVNYDGSIKDWWDSWVKRIIPGGYHPVEMVEDWDEHTL